MEHQAKNSALIQKNMHGMQPERTNENQKITGRDPVGG